MEKARWRKMCINILFKTEVDMNIYIFCKLEERGKENRVEGAKMEAGFL